MLTDYKNVKNILEDYKLEDGKPWALNSVQKLAIDFIILANSEKKIPLVMAPMGIGMSTVGRCLERAAFVADIPELRNGIKIYDTPISFEDVRYSSDKARSKVIKMIEEISTLKSNVVIFQRIWAVELGVALQGRRESASVLLQSYKNVAGLKVAVSEERDHYNVETWNLGHKAFDLSRKHSNRDYSSYKPFIEPHDTEFGMSLVRPKEWYDQEYEASQAEFGTHYQ